MFCHAELASLSFAISSKDKLAASLSVTPNRPSVSDSRGEKENEDLSEVDVADPFPLRF